MPSKTPAQARLMRMACAGVSTKVPKDVACEYVAHDKGKRKFKGKKKRG